MSTEYESTNEPTVNTDLGDYAPGETAIITADGLEAGATVEFQVQHVDGAGEDGIYGTADDLLDAGLDGIYGTDDDGTGPNPGDYASDHATFTVTDGVWWWEAGADGILGSTDDILAGDLDQSENGTIVTSWYVREPDSLDKTFLLSAKEVSGVDGTYTGVEAHNTFTDSRGSYSIDFTAADPGVYIGTIPYPGDISYGTLTGREDGNSLIPNADSGADVESLAPQNMALGQIVPFLFEITVDGTTAPEDGTITFTASWSTVTTNGGNFGYDETYKVIAAFVDTSDSAHMDGDAEGNGEASVAFTTEYNAIDEEILGTFTVTGLDDGDVVVVEAWLVLDSEIPETGIGGNVQAEVVEASTGVVDDPEAENIPAGNETVPLLKPSDFFSAEADLVITKTDLDDQVEPGDSLTYEIIVTNNGPAIANNVVVVDELDPNVTYVSDSNDGSYDNGGTPDIAGDDTVSWDLGAIAVGDSVTFTVTVLVSEDAPTEGLANINNTVTVSSITNDPDESNNTDTEPTDVIVPANPALAIDKTITSVDDTNGNGLTDAGDVIHYNVNVENTGNVTLTGVEVSDPLLGGVLASGVTLAVDAEADYTGSYTITQDDIDSLGDDETGDLGGDDDDLQIDNTATATSNEAATVQGSAEQPLSYDPALAIDKTITSVDDTNGNGLTDAGDVIHYNVNVENTGNVTLTGVEVSDPLLGGVLASGVTLAVDAEADYTGSYTITQDDIDSLGDNETGDLGGDDDDLQIDNTATATSNEAATVQGSAEQPLSYDPALAIDKTITSVTDTNGNGLTDAGDVIHYNVNVENTGNVTLTGVEVSDPLLGGVLASGVTLAVDAEADYTGSYTITQDDIDSLGDDETGDLGGDDDDLQIDNTATATSNEAATVQGSAAQAINLAAALAIDKTITSVDDTNGNGLTDAGDVIHYNVNVENTGNVTLTGVEVSDPLLGGVLASGVTLAVDAEADYTGSYTITQDDIDSLGDDETGDLGGDDDDLQIDNTATATSNEAATVQGSAEQPLSYDPALAIDKTITSVDDTNGNGLTDAGDVIHYNVNVENTGNVTLTGVEVSDPLLGGVLASGVTLAVDAEADYTGSYTITQDDIDSLGDNETGDLGGDDDDLQIDNTATATSNEAATVQGSAEQPLSYDPALAIDKTITSVTDTNGNGLTDAGDVIHYNVNVENTGNVTLTGVEVSDPLLGGVLASGVTLAVDAEADYTGSYTITQDDIDSLGDDETGDLGGDDDDLQIDNTATATSNEAATVEDSESVPLAQAMLDIEKQIKVNGVWFDADGDASMLELLATKDDLEYRIVVTNTGSVDLTGVSVWDPNVGIPESDAYEVGDIEVGGQKILGVGEICELKVCWKKGAVYNTAFADSDQTDVVSDDANFFGAIACLDVDKVTIDENGKVGDNLVVAAGSAVKWQYTVTNKGNVDIDGVNVVDDNGTWDEGDDWAVENLVSGDENDDGILNVGEAWVFVESGTAIDLDKCDDEGRYTNHVLVSATYTDDAGVTMDIFEVDKSSYTVEGAGGDPDDDDDWHHHDDDKGHQHGDDGWHHGGDKDDQMDGCRDDDWFRGHDGHDKMHGRGGQDKLHGDRGRDEVFGGKGADHIHGGAGKDKLHGEAGRDIMIGGNGNDRMWGGAGRDVFKFRDNDDRDTVCDFDAEGRSHDIIDLSGVTAIEGWKDLKAKHLEEVENGVVIRGGDVEIFLKGVDIDDLDRGDFVF